MVLLLLSPLIRHQNSQTRVVYSKYNEYLRDKNGDITMFYCRHLHFVVRNIYRYNKQSYQFLLDSAQACFKFVTKINF